MLKEDMDNFKQKRNHSEKHRFSHKNIIIMIAFLLLAQMGMWGKEWTWYGYVNTEWNNQANWKIIDIKPSGTPSKLDKVVIALFPSNDLIIGAYPVTIAEMVLSRKTLKIKNGGSLTVSGNFTNDSTLIIESGGSLTVNGNFINNGTINNQGTLKIDGNLQDDSAKNVTRSITTTTTITANSVNLTKPVTLSGPISTTSTQSYGDAVKLSGATTLLTPSDITFSKTVDSADTTANSLTMGSGTQKAGTVTFNGNVGGTAPLSKLDVNATSIKFNGGTSAPVITTTGDQIYNGEVATDSVVTVNPKASGNVVFKEPVNFSTIADTTGCAGNITFEKGGTISSATTFNTSGTVTLNTAPATTPVDKNNMTTFSTETNLFTHTAGPTVMNGIVSVGAIKLSSTSDDITIPANTILNFTTDFTNGAKVTNNGTLSLEKNYTNNGTYEGKGTVELCGTGPQTFTSKDTETYTSINVSNSTGTVFFDSLGSQINMDNFSLNCPVEFKKDAVINKDLTITANSTNAQITTTGTASGSASFEVLNFTNEEGATFNFVGTLSVKGNFIDKGTITGLTELKLIGNGTTSKPGTGQQEITPSPSTTYEKINILNTSGPILFKESLKAKSIVDNANAVPITFEKGGVISSDTTFLTTGTVTFGSAASTSSSPSKITMSFAYQTTPTVPAFTFTHTAGPTTIADNAHVILIKTSINIGTNTLTIPETSTLEIPENFTNKSTIKNDGTLIFKKDFTNNANGKITNNNLLQIHGNYDTTNGTYTGTNDNKDIIELCGTAKQIFTAKANETYNNISITNKTGPVEFTTKLAINNLSLSCPVNFTNGVTINNDLTIKSGQPVDITSGSTAIDAFTVNNFIIESGGNLNFGGKLSVQNFKNEGTLNLKNTTVIEVKGDFTDNGTITPIDNLEIHLTGAPDKNAITTNTQTFKPNVSTTYNKILINNKNNKNIPVIFNDKLNVKTIEDVSGYTGNITFEKGGTLSLDTTLYTKGIVTFGSSTKSNTNIGTAASYKSLTHTNGKTVINGTMNVGTVTLGETELIGNITSTEAQTYKGPVTLAGDTELEAPGKDITFESSIGGDNSLTIGTTNKSSKVTFTDNIGKNDSLINSLIVTADNIQLPSNIYAKTQTYTPTPDVGYLILSASGTELSGKDITLYDNINGNSNTLSIYNSGTFTLKDTKTSPNTITGVIDLLNFRQTSPLYTSTVILSGDITASTEISFSSPVTLDDDVALIGEKVSFGSNSTITGSYNLILGDSTTPSTAKTITIGADINNITSLKTYGQNIALPGSITTSGNQLYETDTITLSKDTTLTGTAIELYDTIESSSYALNIINSGILNLKDKTTTPDTTNTVAKVSSFIQNGKGTVTLAGDITATDDISFTKAITLTDNVALIGKNITLSETVSGDKSLILGDSPTTSSITENITITKDIGPILSLEANAKTSINLNANIKTTKAQDYNGPVTLSSSNPITTITTSDVAGEGDIHFYNKVGSDTSHLILNTKAGQTVIFDKEINLNNLKDDANNKGDINISNGGTVKSETVFNTSGKVYFNNTSTNTTFNSNIITCKKGESIITDNINADSITFGKLSMQGTITTKGKQNYEGPVTLTAPAELKITPISPDVQPFPFVNFDNSSSIDLTNLADNALTINAHTLYKGNNITSGNIRAVESDFIIQPENKSIEISADIFSNYGIIDISKIGASNKLTLKGNIKTKSDLVIYGSAFCTTDQESGIDSIYVYDNYKSPVNPVLPSSTPQQNPPEDSSYAGSISIEDNISLESEKNLYINGIKAVTTPNVKANFIFPENYNTINTYSTSFYSDFSGADCNINNSDKSKIVTEACKLNEATQNYNTGWDSNPFIISKAYTIDDNVICIEFDRDIRVISNDEESNKNGLSQLYGNRISYTANSTSKQYNKTIFKQNGSIFNPLLEKDTGVSKIYITAPDTWNTDATGTTAGEGTNKIGEHIENIIPTIEIKRNSDDSTEKYNYFITDIYGKRLLHYSAGGIGIYKENTSNEPDISPAPYDQCSPVLIGVSNGQEFHITNPTEQKSYDAHNFMEFRYSEKVLFGDNTTLNPDFSQPDFNFDNSQNITSSEAGFGEISNNEKGFTLQGIGTISDGKILTGSRNKQNDTSVNTFYRKDSYSLRLSIAGKTSETQNGSQNEKNWDGFIETGTIQPSGNVSSIGSSYNSYIVKDLSGNTSVYKNYTETMTSEDISINIKTPDTVPLGLDEANDNFYTFGNWDLSCPTFAPLNIPDENSVTWGKDYGNQYEILGVATGGTKLQKLEFHLFDNTPDYTSSELVWYSSKGWYSNNIQKAPCADIYGGARPFDEEEKRTTGGIRYHTINEKAFSYTTSENIQKSFISVTPNVVSSFFLGLSATETLTPAGELYFSLELDEKTYPIETTFSISYMPTSETGYITDLAGNKLKTIDKNAPISSIDRTPPTFNILLSPLNQKEIFIVFSKKLETDINKIKFRNADREFINLKNSSSMEEAVPYNFRIIEIDENGSVLPPSEAIPHIDTSINAKFETIRKKNNSELTTLRISLDRPLTYKDLRKYYIQLTPATSIDGTPIETSFDAITGIEDARVTILRDKVGNFMQMYSASPISDFAINFINPIYAYNDELKTNGKNFGEGLYEEGSWAVSDWSENQQNYGTLFAEEAVEIVSLVKNYENDNSDLPKSVIMYVDNTPDAKSVSPQINEDLNKNFRIWLPQLEPDFIFPSVAQTNNSNYSTIISKPEVKKNDINLSKIFFNIDKELASKFGTNQQISFLFALSDNEITDINHTSPIMIYSKLFVEAPNKYDMTKSTQTPLYCLRLSDSSDITSIDLWSYKTKSITRQRGGVTILNNVINATNGEDTVLNISVPEEGSLSIMVLTLDGNIIKYLHRGHITPGEYNYFWDGTNNNNDKVARGLYFIRVVGAGFDETRKVMVVR